MHLIDPNFWPQHDPLSLTQTLEEDGNAQVRVLVPASLLAALRSERVSRRLKADSLTTARFLGDLISERLSQLTPGTGHAAATTPETPAQLQIRWWLAEQTQAQSVSEIVAGTQCAQPTVAVALKTFERLGFINRTVADRNNRPVRCYALSLQGLAQSAQDHEDLATRSIILDRIEGLS